MKRKASRLLDQTKRKLNTRTKGIYAIVNLANGKLYIGSTTRTFAIRWHSHKNQLRHNKHGNFVLQKAWNKYGANNFEFRIVEIIESDEEILKAEQYYIDVFYGINCYNISKVAKGVDKELISEGAKNYWRSVLSQPKHLKYMFIREKAQGFNTERDPEQIDLVLLIHEAFPYASNKWIGSVVGLTSASIKEIITKYDYLSEIPTKLTDERLLQLSNKQSSIPVDTINKLGRPNLDKDIIDRVLQLYDEDVTAIALGLRDKAKSLRQFAFEMGNMAGYVTIRNILKKHRNNSVQ